MGRPCTSTTRAWVELIFSAMRGTLDIAFGRRTGAIMIIYSNDPIQCADHTERAPVHLCGLDMRERVETVGQNSWQRKGSMLWDFSGVGIALGLCPRFGQIGFEQTPRVYGRIGHPASSILAVANCAMRRGRGQIVVGQRGVQRHRAARRENPAAIGQS